MYDVEADQRVAVARAWSTKVKGWSLARVTSQRESLARSTAKRFLSTP
jgi:hypothetical protein